ncbi:hypothetical protein OSB04_020627 [Centaurea solstitialis]|uniref:Uncharacterized protein n=1 Tax=Centaurea solstitialis TaxID=347529 RepID=A0AA38SSM0_9ASTR|nr:hypothetical protein OSB04_020627 [Centaurea solstitialis]
MTGHSGASSTEGSHREEEWDELKEQIRQEKEARLRQEEEIRKEREARLAMEERQKVFEDFMKRFNNGNPPPPLC